MTPRLAPDITHVMSMKKKRIPRSTDIGCSFLKIETSRCLGNLRLENPLVRNIKIATFSGWRFAEPTWAGRGGVVRWVGVRVLSLSGNKAAHRQRCYEAEPIFSAIPQWIMLTRNEPNNSL